MENREQQLQGEDFGAEFMRPVRVDEYNVKIYVLVATVTVLQATVTVLQYGETNG